MTERLILSDDIGYSSCRNVERTHAAGQVVGAREGTVLARILAQVLTLVNVQDPAWALNSYRMLVAREPRSQSADS